MTPLMYVLSVYNEQCQPDRAIDLSFLSQKDSGTIRAEVNRIAKIVNDETKVAVDTVANKIVVDTMQFVNDEIVNINPLTAMLLTRVRNAIPVVTTAMDALEKTDEVDTLTNNAVVLRIEGSPYYAYVFVYKTMQSTLLNYESKIDKIRGVLEAILSSAENVEGSDLVDQHTMKRLQLHASAEYWYKMLLSDYVSCYGDVPDLQCTASEIPHVVRNELAQFGIRGFCNPLTMFANFSTSRIKRKVGVKIDQEIITFLSQVVWSGGGVI